MHWNYHLYFIIVIKILKSERWFLDPLIFKGLMLVFSLILFWSYCLQDTRAVTSCLSASCSPKKKIKPWRMFQMNDPSNQLLSPSVPAMCKGDCLSPCVQRKSTSHMLFQMMYFISYGNDESLGFDWFCSLQKWNLQWRILALCSTTNQNHLRKIIITFYSIMSQIFLSLPSASNTCTSPTPKICRQVQNSCTHFTLHSHFSLVSVNFKKMYSSTMRVWLLKLCWYVLKKYKFMIHLLSFHSAEVK